jgi:hypothetical protein
MRSKSCPMPLSLVDRDSPMSRTHPVGDLAYTQNALLCVRFAITLGESRTAPNGGSVIYTALRVAGHLAVPVTGPTYGRPI